MEEQLRKIAVALIEVALRHLSRDEIEEIIDTVKFSDDPQELEELYSRLEGLLEAGKPEAEGILEEAGRIIRELAEIVGVDPLEIRTPTDAAEAIKTIGELVFLARDRFDCVERERIERIKDYIRDLITQIGSRYQGTDVNIIIQSALDRIEKDEKAIFNPEIYKRIQDLILEREKELESERAKVRERLKLVIKSIVDSLNSLGKSEAAIVDSLSEHVSGIESIIALDNIDEITDKLAQLAKDLRRTISKVKEEIGRTRAELQRAQKQLEELKQEVEKYRERSIIDELTQILNRRGIMDLLVRELARSKRFNTPLSVLMLDIDDFKAINDTYGHIVGDKVLRAIASIVKNNLRITDAVGRYGGEEFLVVLPDTDAEAALVVAEKLRKAVEKKVYKYRDSTFKVTVSIGAAQAKPEDTPESLIDRADKALYLSKQAGKNRVTLAE